VPQTIPVLPLRTASPIVEHSTVPARSAAPILNPDTGAEADKIGEIARSRLLSSDCGTRTFVRPKGFLAAAWKASSDLDITARIERRVGQLNFSDFLASANLGRDTEDAANPDLVPPQSWDAELQVRRNFGAWGTTTARIYTRLIRRHHRPNPNRPHSGVRRKCR
jgi:hypothetical protein